MKAEDFSKQLGVVMNMSKDINIKNPVVKIGVEGVGELDVEAFTIAHGQIIIYTKPKQNVGVNATSTALSTN